MSNVAGDTTKKKKKKWKCLTLLEEEVEVSNVAGVTVKRKKWKCLTLLETL